MLNLLPPLQTQAFFLLGFSFMIAHYEGLTDPLRQRAVEIGAGDLGSQFHG